MSTRPEDYGAVADGVKDCADAINAATEALRIRGGVLEFGPGVYAHASPLRFLSGCTGVKWRGRGTRATILHNLIERDGLDHGIEVSESRTGAEVHHCELSGMTIQGRNNGPTTGNGAVALNNGVWDFDAHDLEICDFRKFGIRSTYELGNEGGRNSYRRIHFHGIHTSQMDPLWEYDGGASISWSHPRQLIHDCRFESEQVNQQLSGQQAHRQHGIYSVRDNSRITNCEFIGTFSNLHLATSAAPSRGLEISGNILRGAARHFILDVDGAHVHGNTFLDTTINLAGSHLVFSGNQLLNQSPAGGAMLNLVGTRTNRLKVIGNQIAAQVWAEGIGIGIDVPSGVSHDRTIIDNNTIENLHHGIVLSGSIGTTVTRNQIRFRGSNISSLIRVTGAEHLHVADNNLDHFGYNNAEGALSVYDGSGRFAGNRIRTGGGCSIYDAVGGLVFADTTIEGGGQVKIRADSRVTRRLEVDIAAPEFAGYQKTRARVMDANGQHMGYLLLETDK